MFSNTVQWNYQRNVLSFEYTGGQLSTVDYCLVLTAINRLETKINLLMCF